MTDNTRWIVYALLGAFFAAVVQVTSKFAFKRNPDLDVATMNAIRALVMTLFFAAVIGYEVLVAQSRQWLGATDRNAKVALAWVLGSGVAASLSWFYGYKALKLTGITKSYPIDKLSVVFGVVLAILLLGERPSGWNWTGILLMVAGAALVTIPQDKSPVWLLGK